MVILNTAVFYRHNTDGNENAVSQNFQKGRDTAPLADMLMFFLLLPEQSSSVICFLDQKTT